MVELEALGVKCGYDATSILEGVTFSIRKGDFVGIVGPNGSGKSTLLRAISRVLRPWEGSVRLDGRDIYSLTSSEVARRIAVVPQGENMVFAFTAGEIVLMGRSPYLGRFQSEGEKDRLIARRAMERTGVLHLAERPINELSSGERQRVILARALAQEPELLLLDEPTSHLDINYQIAMMDLIKRLNREDGLTVVVVIHDLNLASEYCDSLIMLKEGKIFALGRPYEVLTEANIEAVYGARVLVLSHPTLGCPHIILLPGAKPTGNLAYPEV